VELRDLINGAQQAMEQGDYRLAIAAGKHAIVGYEACLAAHRILGESHLELGDQQAAITHFERAAFIDPLNIVAQLGLGVAAEETKRYADAYAHYLSAWEANPALEQVREELVRVRSLLNVEDRLHPTRAGLAGLHTRTGQFGRAANEWRAILAGEPENIRARTALAELLWRQGDDVGAATAAREALRGAPENARALAILADIERRTGGQFADEFSQRFASVDPTGDVLEYMRHLRPDATVDSLLPDSVLIDEFNFGANRTRHTGSLNKKGITASLATSQFAAPDLWDTLVNDLSTDLPPKATPTMSSALEWANDPDAFTSTSARSGGALIDDDFLAALGEDEPRTVPVEAVAPNEPAAMDEPEMESTPLAAEPAEAILDEAATVDVEPVVDADFNFDFVPFSLDEITGEVTPITELNDEAINSSFSFSEDPEPPVAEAVAPVVPKPPVEIPAPVLAKTDTYVDPFIGADGQIDLTSGWDKLDQVIEASKPAAGGGVGFDALVAELDVDGLVPFDAALENPDEDAWTPFSAGDFDAPVPAATVPTPPTEAPLPDATGETLELSDLEAFDVNAYVEPPAAVLGSEIVAGIPSQERSGYTELLRNMDEEALPESDHLQQFDPAAKPDASGAPLAFDELLEVTSADGTGPLAAEHPEPAPVYGEAVAPDVAGLEGFVPFDPTATEGLTLEQATPFTFEDPAVAEPALAAVAPFSFDDAVRSPSDGSPVDFSDLNSPASAVDFAPATNGDGLLGVDEPDAVEAAAIAEVPAPETVEPNGHEIEPGGPFALEESEPVAAPMAGTGREQVATNGNKVHWPPFVAQTSELIDRGVEKGSLFARIAAQKESMVERGVVTGGKRLVATQQPAASGVAAPVAAVAVAVAEPREQLGEEARGDLMIMRVRLIEDDGSAQEVADELEAMIADGLQSPLAMRVLGEAYLKLGLVERAAAQFRQAMLYRRRVA
jgi:Tfp pilus assembly protein PilF